MKIALDASYSLGSDLSGVGIYSREILWGLAGAHPEQRFTWLYRPHRLVKGWREEAPANVSRGLLAESLGGRAGIFHGLNQRLPSKRFARQIATFHDLFVLTADYSTPEFRERFAEQARRAAGEADRIIAVSHFTAGQVESLLGVGRERIHVVHHGVRPLPESARQRENIILSVGAIQRRKNTARLVDAFAAVEGDWTLVLAGSAGYGADETLRRIEASPRRDRIRVTGYVSPQELADWYARCAIFAFPSLDEGFGMPVLEAMAAGAPVIASNRSAIPEVAGDAAMLVNPEETEELASALRRLAGDAQERQRLAARGRTRAAQFTWQKAVQETWEVYVPLGHARRS